MINNYLAFNSCELCGNHANRVIFSIVVEETGAFLDDSIICTACAKKRGYTLSPVKCDDVNEPDERTAYSL